MLSAGRVLFCIFVNIFLFVRIQSESPHAAHQLKDLDHMGPRLKHEWVSIISDWMIPYKNISRATVDFMFENGHENLLLIQHIEGEIYVIDKSRYCYPNPPTRRIDGKEEFMMQRCEAIVQIFKDSLTESTTSNFELVLNLQDEPTWGVFEGPSQTMLAEKGHLPEFSCLRCWQFGSLPIPLFGSHEPFNLSALDESESSWFDAHESMQDFNKREDKVVFRGETRGCSIPPDIDVRGSWFFPPGRDDCGRSLLYKIAQSSPQYIDYNFEHLSMQDQENLFKYAITVEGHGGWTDRLFQSLFSSQLIFIQDHPCKEWYEHLLIPFLHYVPVSNNFENLLPRIKWAINHPDRVSKIISRKRLLARTMLNRNGIVTYVSTLLSAYASAFDWNITKRSLAIKI